MTFIFEHYSKDIVFFAKTKYFIFSFSVSLILYCSLELLDSAESSFSEYLAKYGEYSYGLYLIHVPVITITFVVLKDIFKMELNSYTGIIVFCISLILGRVYGKLDVSIHKCLSKEIMKKYKLQQ